MASASENRTMWGTYHWDLAGDEWSSGWATTQLLWHRGLLPRIAAFLPARSILEIAPGFGRCTQYLLPQCQQYRGVDVTAKCVQYCKERFDEVEHAEFVENDGTSLDAIASGSIDFAFSWDSLVHCDSEVLKGYLSQLADKLAKGGIGVFHHSNLLSVEPSLRASTKGWRGKMSAALFREYCQMHGLCCIAQEIIPWSSGELLTDCISTFVRADDPRATECVISENVSFLQEMAQSRAIHALYDPFQRFVRALEQQPSARDTLLDKIAGRRVIGWGAGEFFEQVASHLPFELDYLVDKSQAGSKKRCAERELEVHSPDKLLNEKAEDVFVFVFSERFYREIFNALDNSGKAVIADYLYLSVPQWQALITPK